MSKVSESLTRNLSNASTWQKKDARPRATKEQWTAYLAANPIYAGGVLGISDLSVTALEKSYRQIQRWGKRKGWICEH